MGGKRAQKCDCPLPEGHELKHQTRTSRLLPITNVLTLPPSQVKEIHEGLHSLRRMVSELENKQKTVLGVALPEESECFSSQAACSSSSPGTLRVLLRDCVTNVSLSSPGQA